MKKQIFYLTLPLLLTLAGCSKGTKIENIAEKKAIVNEVAEGATKRLGHDDFVFELGLSLDGEFTSEEGKFVFDDFELESEGEFDFPDILEKGSDISNIKAHLGLVTDGDLSLTMNGATTNVDCDADFAELYFQQGTIYADVAKSNLAEFLVGILGGELELPLKSKLNLAELIDPNSVIDLQKDFTAPNIPEEILSQVEFYVSDDEYIFELDTSEAVMQDKDGVQHNVEDYYGLDITASLVVDKSFRLQELELDGEINLTKFDKDNEISGEISISLDLDVDYEANPSVKSVSNPEAYKQFKLFK